MAASGKLRVAPWSPSASREEARAYVQSRLALFSKLMFWVFWVFVGFVYALYSLWPDIEPHHVGYVFRCALVGQVAFGAIWYFALERRRPSLEWLYRIDVFYAVIIGAELGNSAFAQSELPAAIYSAIIAHICAILARALIVPSSGRRTAVVTSLSFVPLLASGVALGVYRPHDLDIPPLALVVGATVFGGIVVLLATTGSRVIYGLRRQVSAAMQLGQYTLEHKIGEGGMGVVYRARHAMLLRPTAIKLLPPERHDADSLARFEREVQNMSQLTHPNTVAIFDYGRSVEGVFYYAMEYLDGVDLETLIRREGPLPAARVAHVLSQVCGALAEAHGRGLTHRDIKPANIILCCRGGKPDVAIVVDFGLVNELERTGNGQPGSIAGTPAYMAPEAIVDPARVGPASDLYALGAVGYYLLTGARVFDGETRAHVCAQHVTATPVPPSQRIAGPVPADLEELILQCLAKDPDQRPVGAAELRRTLRALPAYREWDESHAAHWWSDFEQRRSGDRTAADPAPGRTITITRDLSSPPEAGGLQPPAQTV